MHLELMFITTVIVLSIAKCLNASKIQDRVIQACVGENVTLFNSTDNINTIVDLTVTAKTEQNEQFFVFRDNKFMKGFQLPGYPVKIPDPGKGFVDVVLLNVTLNQSGLYTIEVDNIQGSVNTSVIRVNLTISELCSSNISLDLDNKTNGPTSKVNDTDSGPGDGKDGTNSTTVAVLMVVLVAVLVAVPVLVLVVVLVVVLVAVAVVLTLGALGLLVIYYKQIYFWLAQRIRRTSGGGARGQVIYDEMTMINICEERLTCINYDDEHEGQ